MKIKKVILGKDYTLCKEFRITTRKRARYAPESLCVVHVNKDSDSLKQ